MRKHISRTAGLSVGLATGLAMGLAIGLGPPAAADDGAWETGHFEWGETIEDFCDVPGLTVEDVGSGDSRFRTLLRGPAELPYEAEHSVDTDVYTNLANGMSVTVVEHRHGRVIDVTDNEDGTLTITFVNAGHRVMTNDAGEVIARAAGSAEIRTVWDHAGTPSDRGDDEFLSFELVRSSGSELDLCGAAVPAIT